MDFHSLSLDGSGMKRRPRVRASKQLPDYLTRFDADTLWLDAVWRDGILRLICPRLNNLYWTLRFARFRLDGVPTRARFARFYRHTVISMKSPRPPETVSVDIGDWTGQTRVSLPEDLLFAGRNVLFVLSKNNEPSWIEDWVRFHVFHHGADAVLLVDNGSTETSLTDIAAAITRGGVDQRLVLSAPLPFGPIGKPPFVNSELFLQTGVMNAVRWRYLYRARAVLATDIDELVSCSRGSIFDAAVASPQGYVAIPGQWAYPAPGSTEAPRHATHIYRDDPAQACSEKWCMVPDGPMKDYEWRVHKLEGLRRGRRFLLPGSRLYHCRAITTGWKSRQRLIAPEGTVPDDGFRQAVAAAGLQGAAGSACT